MSGREKDPKKWLVKYESMHKAKVSKIINEKK